MIEVEISDAAYRAIARTLPPRTKLWVRRGPQGGMLVWLDRRILRRLEALRRPSEGLSDIILRVAAAEEERRA